MRITCTVRGDLEAYVQEQMKKTGLSAAMVMLQLAISGMDYKNALMSMTTISAALRDQSSVMEVQG